ncbi:MAG TPA: hypothetical protein VNX46_14505 [Candidatus Acidoferrum sp.]|jgi:hypothetical protein|nr:hypothetical protein [Candidatus Acidoferrum sp.]
MSQNERQIQQEGTEVTEKKPETLLSLLAPVQKYLRPRLPAALAQGPIPVAAGLRYHFPDWSKSVTVLKTSGLEKMNTCGNELT